MPDKKYLNAVVQVVAGLGLNIFPAMFIAVYARIAPIELQGFLALSLAVGVYVAQLINAFIVEGRLATPAADHDLSLPGWVALLSLAAGFVLIVGPPVTLPAALMASSIGIMTGLLVARSIGVVSGSTVQEALASLLLIVSGAGAIVLAARHSDHSVRLLAAGALAAILIRYLPRTAVGRWGLPPDIRRSSWVTAETAVVGAVQPAITSLVLTTIGPAASVAFRVVSTVSGALEPIIAYGRYRLLAHGHRGEVAIVVGIFSAGLAIVLIAAFGGFGKLVFGPAWSQVGAAALLLACLWKGLMLVSTVPFAALRKAGETKVVFWIRALSSVVYLATGSAFLWIWHSNTAVFAAFVLAETLTAVLYHRTALRSAPDYEASFGHRSAGGSR